MAAVRQAAGRQLACWLAGWPEGFAKLRAELWALLRLLKNIYVPGVERYRAGYRYPLNPLENLLHSRLVCMVFFCSSSPVQAKPLV